MTSLLLSHLVHAFGFRLIEGHVIEVVKRFRMNSRTLIWIRNLEARKGELQLRTCVYSRYASLKTNTFKWFYLQSTASPVVACDQGNPIK